jgi:hypothetical protein
MLLYNSRSLFILALSLWSWTFATNAPASTPLAQLLGDTMEEFHPKNRNVNTLLTTQPKEIPHVSQEKWYVCSPSLPDQVKVIAFTVSTHDLKIEKSEKRKVVAPQPEPQGTTQSLEVVASSSSTTTPLTQVTQETAEEGQSKVSLSPSAQYKQSDVNQWPRLDCYSSSGKLIGYLLKKIGGKFNIDMDRKDTNAFYKSKVIKNNLSQLYMGKIATNCFSEEELKATYTCLVEEGVNKHNQNIKLLEAMLNNNFDVTARFIYDNRKRFLCLNLKTLTIPSASDDAEPVPDSPEVFHEHLSQITHDAIDLIIRKDKPIPSMYQ